MISVIVELYMFQGQDVSCLDRQYNLHPPSLFLLYT